MLVTADELELPLAVRDSVREIAELIDRLPWDVCSMISRKTVSLETYNGYKFKIVKVDIADEDDEE